MEMFDLLAHRARVSSDRVAVEDLADGQTYTYAELNERSARVAAAARSLWGLLPGDRLAYLGENRAEFFALLFACAKAEVILVPLNWRLAEPELLDLLNDCSPSVLIHTAGFAATAVALQDSDDASFIRVAMDGKSASARCYLTDIAQVSPDLSPHPLRDPDTPWYLLYTSGTTGRPKGVIQTFRMMMANYFNIGLSISVTEQDVLLNVLPMFHTAGINLYSTSVLLVGGTVLVARGFDATQALDVLESRATLFFAVPAVYQTLLDHPEFSGQRLSGVRSWGCGGAPLSLPVTQRFVAEGIRVRTGYGMTETGPGVFLLDENQVIQCVGSVGKPFLLADVRIVDAQGCDLSTGDAGEMLIRGPGITPGYWNQPEATRQAIDEDGWLHTGDVAKRDAAGNYTIVDRWKDMYISGGENVYPAEVEKVLAQHPDIQEVAVIGVPDDRWGEVGQAFVVTATDCPPPSAEALSSFCRRQLAGYKVPRYFSVMGTLPRNALGKITKQVLRQAQQTTQVDLPCRH
ncbi:MAG: AMP-binding protein [Natronospirillum sp.]